MIEKGDTALGGRLPVNPSGGLLSKGEPLGASALGQVTEIVHQLRGLKLRKAGSGRTGGVGPHGRTRCQCFGGDPQALRLGPTLVESGDPLLYGSLDD